MNNADKIKNMIARELTYFIINENIKPSEINIDVKYPQTNALLHISEDKISEAFEERKEV